MKFTCRKNILIKEIITAHDITPAKSNIPVLSNVLLELSNNELTIKATDTNTTFETKILVKSERNGKTTILCDKFLNILRSLPEGDIFFELLENNEINITSEKKDIEFNLKSFETEKFPEIRDVDHGKYFEIPQKNFIEMIEQTIFSVSTDDNRLFMMGIYMEKEEDNVIMVSTDGRRLSYIKKEFPELNIPSFSGIIIPPKFLNLVRKLSVGEGNFKIAIEKKFIYIKFNNQILTSVLFEGQFPSYDKVIPKNQENSFKINKDEFLSALRRVSIMTEEKSRRIYMVINENKIDLKSESTEIGMAHENISCTYTGEEKIIAINYSYLMDPLKVMESENTLIEFTDINKAVTLKDEVNKDYFHIIMPMQLD